MIEYILFALWFFLPAGLANAAPVFASRIPLLKEFETPIDFGLSHNNKRLLGDNKTWRGIFFGIFIAVIVLYLQKLLYTDSSWLQETLPPTIDYNTVTLWLGILLGSGALFGDAVESFLKRKLNIPPGESWLPFDQIDYIIGGLLASWFIVGISVWQVIAIFIIWFGLHIVSSYGAYLFGLKERPI